MRLDRIDSTALVAEAPSLDLVELEAIKKDMRTEMAALIGKRMTGQSQLVVPPF